MLFPLVLVLVLLVLCIPSRSQKPFEYPDHARKSELINLLNICHKNATYCEARANHIVDLAANIANDYSGLLLPDVAQSFLQEAFYYIDPDSKVGSHLNHMIAVLAFSQGDLPSAELYWNAFNKTDLVSLRSLSAQTLMKGNEEKLGMELMFNYSSLLSLRFEYILQNAFTTPTPTPTPTPTIKALNDKNKIDPIITANNKMTLLDQITMTVTTMKSKVVDILCNIGEFVIDLFIFNNNNTTKIVTTDIKSKSKSKIIEKESSIITLERVERQQHTEHSQSLLLDLLLSEAQGSISKSPRMVDIGLSGIDLVEMDTKQRFRLAVGLAKLGLFDLSLRHVWLSATPWEAPLYLFRAKLVFSPVHKDVRSLALAVYHFERQGEQILSQKKKKYPGEVMERVCDSPNEAALALQSLPLLHLAGYSSPRHSLTLGHSPVALSVLLSEVFMKMCPPHETPSHLHPSGIDNNDNDVDNDGFMTIRIGIVSGSTDGIPGKIVVGLLSSIERKRLIAMKVKLELIAMNFPTPRDRTTDSAHAVFDIHINLPPHNKTQAIKRILNTKADIVLFADAALDSRVFALAHERLAVWQGSLWGYGSTIGIKTIDFYFVPEPFFTAATCPVSTLSSDPLNSKDGDLTIDSDIEYFEYNNQPPQKLFSEQVVFLQGLPPLPKVQAISRTMLWKILEAKYLLPPSNQIHLYLFPGSVRHMHPEFDAVLEVLLRTDPTALVVLAVPRTGRDNLPTDHVAVRHDLMHPTMPVAAVSKLRQRLRSSLGVEGANRVRILPPLDESVYHALRRQAIAVFDPFPVGMHVQILEALKEGIPVVSAPALQECTHSHMPGISRALKLSFWDYPTTPEEYAVLAMRLQREQSLQMTFVPPDELRTSFIHKEERHSTLSPDRPIKINHTDRNIQDKSKDSNNNGSGSDIDKKVKDTMETLEEGGSQGDQLVSFLLRLKQRQQQRNSTGEL
jgi:hypothetical protein